MSERRQHSEWENTVDRTCEIVEIDIGRGGTLDRTLSDALRLPGPYEVSKLKQDYRQK